MGGWMEDSTCWGGLGRREEDDKIGLGSYSEVLTLGWSLSGHVSGCLLRAWYSHYQWPRVSIQVVIWSQTIHTLPFFSSVKLPKRIHLSWAPNFATHAEARALPRALGFGILTFSLLTHFEECLLGITVPLLLCMFSIQSLFHSICCDRIW